MTLQEHAKNFGGVYALMLTPFKEDKSIDYDIYPEYVRWQISQNPHHLFAVCGSSEMAELTLDERVKLAELTVKHKQDKKVFVTGNLEPGWYGQLEEIKRMEATGVDGLVFVTKGYGNDDARMTAYLTELVQHTTVPILLYEYPGYKNNKMSGYAYGKVVETGKFFGIKDTTCTMEGIKEKIAVQKDSAVLQANIPYLLEAYEAGGRGVMATPSTCGVSIMRKMWDCFVNGDIAGAKEQHANVCSLSNASDGGFCATAKYFVKLQGVPMTTVTRSPKDLSPQKLKSLEVWHDWAVSHGIMK